MKNERSRTNDDGKVRTWFYVSINNDVRLAKLCHIYMCVLIISACSSAATTN